MCEPVPIGENSRFRFWIVWAPSHGEPAHRYSTLDAAKTEAAALSKKYPGERVYCLRARGYGYTESPVVPPTAFRLLEPRPK